MGRNNDSPTRTNSDSTSQDVYMPSTPPSSIVEAAGSKLFRRRGSIKPASEDD
ncbi:MAG: hypothetical protein ABEH88_02185 [Halobacteriales archaeon]